MKILFLARPFNGEITGTGEQIVAQELYKVFQDEGFTISCMKYIPYIKPYGSLLSIITYDYIYCLIYAISNIFVKYDYIFFNSPFQATLVPIFNLRSTTTVLIHDLFFKDYNRTYFDTYAKLIHRIAFLCKNIITTTRENQIKLKENYNIHSVIIHPGLGKALLQNRISEKIFSSNVGYIGGYNEWKRIFKIINFLGEKNENITFYFAGRIPENYKSLILKYKKINVTFLGTINEFQKVHFFRNIGFLYLPTLIEGFGLPILESLFFKVVPIVHYDSEIPAILKDKCIKIQNETEIKEVIKELKENPTIFYRLVSENQEYALKQFSYRRFSHFIKNEVIKSS